jgi:dipeptidase E
MQMSVVCEEAIRLTNKVAENVNVLYVGTASYDNQNAATNQTKTFTSLGAQVDSLALSDDRESAATKFAAADIIVVSGGNTLFAVDRWKHLGIDLLFAEVVERGVVLAGGSAGAIVAFESGHSDSGDPESFYQKGEVDHSWEYVRVPGLNFLPGLCCPHYDKVQSNGILRAIDFNDMLKRHAGERGIGIDHWAALSIEGEKYQVISPNGKEGSVLEDGTFSEAREGRAGVWILDCEQENVIRTLVPSTGNIIDLLKPATAVVEDARIEAIRKQNPGNIVIETIE